MKGLRSTIGIYGFHEFKLWPFLNAPIRLGIIRSGTKLSLLTETLTGTLVELRDYPHKTSVFTLETSTARDSGIENPEAWMLTIRQHAWQPTSTTADHQGISFFFSQCQQCFGSKPTNHERCLLYTSPSPRDGLLSRMPSSA